MQPSRIVAKVDHLMALVDKLEAQLTASRATADQLLSALVAELTSHTAGTPMRITLSAQCHPTAIYPWP